MKNSYKVIVKTQQGAQKNITHDVPAPGSFGGALKIKAAPGARYQLVDNTTGQGPDNIRVQRAGNDLRISFEGRDEADVVISHYYEQTEPNFGAVIGETDPDVYHAYMPESGETAALIGNLSDGASNVGMALGGEQVVASGAAVGALVAAAGFNPLLAAPLALLGAGGGGGGGAAAPTATDTTPPKVTAAKLVPEDDTGVSASDGITADNTPRLLIDADSDAKEVTVTLNGKTHTSITKNPQGQFVVQVPDADALGNGVHPFTVVAKDAAGNVSPSWPGSFTVDRSGSENYLPGTTADANQAAAVQITAMSDDTGYSATDFITSDNTLVFDGTLSPFVADGQNWVELHLLDQSGAVIASQYVQPSNNNGAWRWSWDNTAQALADGAYKLTAQLVDPAGNPVSTALATKDITIDTNAVPESQASFPLTIAQLVQDSGASATDFLTNQQKLSFVGNIGDTNTGFSGYKVLVQVLGTDGKIQSQNYVDPEPAGAWSYDNRSQTLGVSGVNTQYLLKASVVDLAGNILKSTDQSFTVDLKAPVFSRNGGSTSDGDSYLFSSTNPLTLQAGIQKPDGTYSASEVGTFTFFNGVDPISSPAPMNGAALSYAANSLKIVYTDLAGNAYFILNDKTWVFGAPITVQNVPLSNPSPSSFGNGELAGSIGTYILGPDELNIDLSDFHSTSPKVVGDTATSHMAAMNHIGLSGSSTVANAAHTLTLTTSDVLSLGVKNSFVSDGRQQMRIDGDAADKVVLDDLVGGSTFAWDKAASTVALSAGQNYVVYSNAALGLDLFIQQGIQVTAVL